MVSSDLLVYKSNLWSLAMGQINSNHVKGLFYILLLLFFTPGLFKKKYFAHLSSTACLSIRNVFFHQCSSPKKVILKLGIILLLYLKYYI